MPEKNEITSILDAHVGLRDENASLRSRLQELDGEARKVPALKGEVERLKKELEAARGVAKRKDDAIDALNEERLRLESINTDVDALHDALTDAHESIERHLNEKEIAEESLSAVKLQNAKLSETLDRAAAKVADLNEIKAKYDHLKELGVVK